jgi:hypothetical protein
MSDCTHGYGCVVSSISEKRTACNRHIRERERNLEGNEKSVKPEQRHMTYNKKLAKARQQKSTACTLCHHLLLDCILYDSVEKCKAP